MAIIIDFDWHLRLILSMTGAVADGYALPGMHRHPLSDDQIADTLVSIVGSWPSVCLSFPLQAIFISARMLAEGVRRSTRIPILVRLNSK